MASRTSEGGKHHSQAYIGEEIEDYIDEEIEEPPEAFECDLNDNLTEEGSAIWSENQREIDTAWAVLREARRTLKAAREKQHQVKLARKYYQPRDRENSGRPRDDSGMTCLRCGLIGHRARNCPKKAGGSCRDRPVEANGSLRVLRADHRRCFWLPGPPPRRRLMPAAASSTAGRPRPLDQFGPLEQIFKRNIEKYGKDRVEKVDLSDRPVFGFGNSSEGQCVSTIHLGVDANQHQGKLLVHALDEGEGPVLFSIDALRKLDALIDFRRDLVVFS